MKLISLRIRVVLFVALVCVAASSPAFAQTFQQSTYADGGVLSWTVSESTAPCGPQEAYSYTQYQFSSFQYEYNGTTYPLNGAGSAYIQDNGGTYGCPSTGPQPASLPIPLPSNFGDAQINFESEDAGNGSATVQSNETFDPAYKVVSILDAPPGNQSTQGYGDSTTDGTTTTVGSSFTNSQSLTYTAGSKSILAGTSATTGYAKSSSDSQAYTQTFTDAIQFINDLMGNSYYNPNGLNAENHNLDDIYVWLNPEVSVVANDSTPVSFSITSQPISGVTTPQADILPVPAVNMEPKPGSVTSSNPSGTSDLFPSTLNPQNYQTPNGTIVMPGLASVCKNLNVSEYEAGTCTQADQCGCNPDDFSGILTQDALLNYNPSTHAANPYPGTTDPLTLDKSGVSTCDQSTIPDGSNCRYVVVPIAKGSIDPQFERLSGSQALSYSQSDSNSATFTNGSSTSRSVSVSHSFGIFNVGLTATKTWTWTNSQSDGSTEGAGNSLNLTFQTSTPNCGEDVSLYEDTVFHTYVFQVPTGDYGCN